MDSRHEETAEAISFSPSSEQKVGSLNSNADKAAKDTKEDKYEVQGGLKTTFFAYLIDVLRVSARYYAHMTVAVNRARTSEIWFLDNHISCLASHSPFNYTVLGFVSLTSSGKHRTSTD